MQKRVRDRWLVNLGLLLGIALLAGILLLDQTDDEDAKPTLASKLPDDITRIKITNAGRQPIEFEKQNNVWLMLSPHTVAADPVQIKNLLSLTEQTINSELDSAGLKLADFGLQQPVTQIQFNDISIAFGGPQPVNRQRYILLNQQVLLIDDGLQEQLNASSISFADRKLIAENTHIEQITIDGQVVAEDQLASLKTQWQQARANWISLLDGEASGKHVAIKLQSQAEPLTWFMQQREYDLVLIQPTLMFEYHLAGHMGELLGLVKPKIEPKPVDSNDASGNMSTPDSTDNNVNDNLNNVTSGQ